MPTSNSAIRRTRLETYRTELEEGSHRHLRPEHRLRLEIMLRADRGESQRTICAALGCAPGTARFWMKMMELGEIDAWASAPIGRPQKVSPEYLARLRELVCHSPKTYGYAIKQWTALFLRQQLIKELGIDVSDRHINRLLNEMQISSPYRHKSSRPSRGQNRNSAITIQDLQPQ
ncbi:MAG: helix-turn-helix domain-containing protein [Thermosynechococcaceae cyanobacterium]